MGILDKVKSLVGKHEAQVKKGIDKVAQTADEKTGGKHSDKIDDAAERAKAEVDKLNE
jgi:MT0933-like antitoxin protein